MVEAGSEWVVLKTFSSRMAAEVVRGLLEQNGIASVIQADDAGGAYPHLTIQAGVKLLVERNQVLHAKRLLDQGEEPA